MKTVTHQIPGLTFHAHTFEVPLDHRAKEGRKITCFAREIVATGKVRSKLPALVYLQGGPGFGAPRPVGKGGWLGRALSEFRVILLDQRGTGLSAPITARSLAAQGDVQAQTRYLRCFRADSIVRDAEVLRSALIGDQPWTLLGQSFGGFCAAHYQFAAPQGLSRVLITGGIPPIGQSIDDVYRATYKRVLERNERFFKRYPQDQEVMRAIVDRLGSTPVALPGGGRLTPRRFQQLGLRMGMSDGLEALHFLLEGAFDHGELSYNFLRAVEGMQHFETNPIYALLHEAIYCEGSASRWSAHRMREEFPQLEIRESGPVFWTGETVYPWMFEDYAQLRPMREVAERLAQIEDWEPLYGERADEVPGAAAMYYDDMYVERAFSEEAVKRLPGLKLWVTNGFDHNGIGVAGAKIFERLIRMSRNEM